MLRGGEDGFRKPELLRDRAGNPMHTGRYWDPVSRKHTSGEGPGCRAYSAFPLDWDADGDLDLVVGGDDGSIFLRVNEGTAREPAFAQEVVPVRAGQADARVPGYAMPVAADWDGDGSWDLVSGSKDGSVHWFRNAGEPGEPRLEAPRTLVRPVEGQGPSFRSQVDVADFDGDGDMDLLVGDHTSDRVDGEYVRHGWIWLYRRTGSPVAGSQGQGSKE